MAGVLGLTGPALAAQTSSSNTKTNAAPAPVLRMNVGGPAVTTGGQSWLSDRGFTGGVTNTTTRTEDITDTANDVLYRSERWGGFSYQLPVPSAGDYVVRLHFAEYYFSTAGSRVFSMNLEGGPVEMSNVDLVASVGAMRAVVKEFTVPVRDGQLSLSATGTVDHAKLSAIEILPVQPGTSAQPVAVAPSAPTSVGATADAAAGAGTFSLSWASAVDGGSPVTGYRVARDGTDATGSGAWSTVLPATARSFTFWNLSASQRYALSVQAINAVGTGPAGVATVPAAVTPAPTPTPTPTSAPAPTPTSAPAPAPQLSARDYTLQPFSSTSIWNLPIGTGASFESATDSRTANVIGAGGVWVNESQYSHPITRATAADPVAVMTDSNDSSRSGSYRIPTTASIAGGTDAHMHVISPDGRSIDEAWAVTRRSATDYTTGRHHTVDLYGNGIGPRNGTRAYGGSAIGGLIRAWEVDPNHPKYTGVIKHPIAIALRNDQLLHTGGGVGYRADGTMLQSGYVWPATEQDWDSPWSYSGRVPMGSYLAIPSTVDLSRLGLTPQGLMLARAYQDYGAYVTDRAGDMILAFVEPSPAGKAFTDPLVGPDWTAADLKKIRTELRVVTNNTPSTPNGASLTTPRRAPLLP